MIKLFGALCIVAGCMGMAYGRINEWRNKYDQLQDLIDCIRILDGQVCFCHMPLPELFAEIEEKNKTSIGRFFGEVSREMEKQKGEMLRDIWERVADANRDTILLDKEDFFTFRSLGRGLGYLDVEMQKKYISGKLSQLSERLPKRQKNYREKEKIIRSFGFAAAALCLLILL